MKYSAVIACLAAGLGWGSQAHGQRFSDIPTDPFLPTIIQSKILWAEDFDNYCVGGAAWLGYPTVENYGQPTETWSWPAKCPTDGSATPDDAAFHQNWVLEYGDAHSISTSGFSYPARFSEPFSGKSPGGNATAGRHAFDLTPAIQYKGSLTGRNVNGVNGTDANPLVLKFWMQLDPAGVGWEANAMWYTELALGDERAPTDFVTVNCDIIPPVGPYPLVTQQWLNGNEAQGPKVPHPPLKDRIWASVAVGAFAAQDVDPCDLETGHRPTTYHLAFFDGRKWYDLRQNIFLPGSGDFNIDSPSGEPCWVTLEIKSTTYRLVYNKAGAVSWATIPRPYLGPFNVVHSGPGMGCEQDVVSGECVGPYKAFDWPNYTEDWAPSYYDSMILHGGELVSVDGACCNTQTGTCTVIGEATCQAQGGRWDGVGTACGAIPCCPRVPFDLDSDDDIDMEDFAVLQRCITTGGGTLLPECVCLNTQGNGIIDDQVISRFATCSKGPDMPFEPTCFSW